MTSLHRLGRAVSKFLVTTFRPGAPLSTDRGEVLYKYIYNIRLLERETSLSTDRNLTKYKQCVYVGVHVRNQDVRACVV